MPGTAEPRHQRRAKKPGPSGDDNPHASRMVRRMPT
jgi:hypothetical protein